MSNNQQFQAKKKQKVIGEYSIGKTIGFGTFASVREGTHIKTGQKVSIKILNKNMIEETRDKVNLSRQIRIMKKIRHPNVAQLFQIMETSNRMYFVMEFIQGGELYTKITSNKKGRLDQKFSGIIFQQLMNAIQYLHEVGIAHRDIKPENILLDKNNNVKIIDFGLSTFYQKNQKLKTSCGSPCYAAPEMLVQEMYNPQSADIWSCGIVLYAMVCGFLPFEDKSTKVLYEKIKMGYYEEPNFLSEQVKSLISFILKFDPIKRPSINQIREHSFCSPRIKKIPGLLPSENLHLQQIIIVQMNKLGYYGFRPDVQTHKNSPSTAAYFLLLYKYLQKENIPLETYFNKLIQENRVRSPIKSKSLVLKRQSQTSISKINRKNSQIKINDRYNSNNEEESDFLDKLIQKNIRKLRERSMSIKIRKAIS